MQSRKTKARLGTLLAAAAIAACGAVATADQNTQASLIDDGASERINLSGKLRMLSQRVVATGCYVGAGVDTENTLPALMGVTEEFGTILAALEFGNPDLGIYGAEERRRTQVGLGKLNEFWAPAEEQARLIAAGAADTTNVQTLSALSAPLLEFAIRMVAEISAQYSNPAILVQADAMLIDIAGRQRMLAQRISKNACLIGTGLAEEGTLAELNGASEIFESSLYALANGMPEAGVRPPPTPEIAEALAAVIARWTALQPTLASLENAGPEDLARIYHETTALTAGMNAIVSMYSSASKSG